MIATLNGKVAEKLGEVVVLDVGGVGYGVLVTGADGEILQEGDATKLYIYEHIREDVHDLYGFTKQANKLFFEQLISVNGVGPRMALHILGIGSIENVATAIASGDTKYIQQAHGVGKRVAERIVVDLKDKVGLASSGSIENMLMNDSLTSQDEAVQALMALGLTQSDAVRALSNIDKELSTPERVKKALKEGVN